MIVTATAPPSSSSGTADHRPPLLGVLMVAAVAIAVLAGWTLVGRFTTDEAVVSGLGPMESIDQSVFAGETGVWIEHVALIGDGGLIEIRFRILDSDRSQIIHDLDNPPRIVAQDGFELRFQRHEHPHADANKLGITKNEQLVNLGNYFQAGDVVTVMIGNAALEGVPIQ